MSVDRLAQPLDLSFQLIHPLNVNPQIRLPWRRSVQLVRQGRSKFRHGSHDLNANRFPPYTQTTVPADNIRRTRAHVCPRGARICFRNRSYDTGPPPRIAVISSSICCRRNPRLTTNSEPASVAFGR
jgi:hypothetical protein